MALFARLHQPNVEVVQATTLEIRVPLGVTSISATTHDLLPLINKELKFFLGGSVENSFLYFVVKILVYKSVCNAVMQVRMRFNASFMFWNLKQNARGTFNTSCYYTNIVM